MVVVLGLAVGCQSTRVPPSNWFRAVVANAEGVEFPFLFHVPEGTGKATVMNGTFGFEVDATSTAEQLELSMPVFHGRLIAKRSATGLEGWFETSTTFGGKTSMKFIGTAIEGSSVTALGVDGRSWWFLALDLGSAESTWRVQLGGSTEKLVLHQLSPGAFSAVLTTESGDITYLGGVGSSNHLVLTGFDGTGAYRLDVILDGARAHARGRWTAGQAGESSDDVQLVRDDRFVLTPKVAVTSGIKLELPELAAYAGKPTLLELAGSWCSTCRTVSPFLVDLYKSLHPRGLEIVTLLYEFSTDANYNAKQVELFVKAYGIPWNVIAMPGELGEFHGLEHVDVTSFPLTLFLDSNHVVMGLHAGFPLPSDEAAYREAAEHYRTEAIKILGP